MINTKIKLADPLIVIVDAIHRRLIICLIIVFVTACGSGTGRPAFKTITITGTVTYTSYKPELAFGLNYSVSIEKPIRGAIIELQNSSGTVFDSSNTTSTGGYTLTAPENSSVRIVVKAALGSSATADTKIIDNTSSAALYALALDVSTGSSNLTQNFNANSGWNGVSYLDTRAAAPFAILDVIYKAQQKVLVVDSNVVFPQLLVNWSINNKPASGNFATGNITTTHFNSNGQIYILGAADIDTDEYDTHIIAHEWAHYFEANFSRSNSTGGEHSGSDILDPALAFSEGFGNALAGIVMDDPLYIDTSGNSQAMVAVSIDVDADSILDTNTHVAGNLIDGFYSESSIQEVLYDLYDSGDSDDDNISLGFTPIYHTLLNGHKTTPAFTTIYSFLHYLKLSSPASSVAIASLALAENIKDGDEYEASASPLYTTIPFDGTIVSTDVNSMSIKTYITYGPITASSHGNKLFNRLYFKYTATATGCYSFVATPTAGGDLIIYDTKNAPVDLFFGGVSETFARTFTSGEEGVFAVGSFGGEEAFTVRLYSTPSAC